MTQQVEGRLVGPVRVLDDEQVRLRRRGRPQRRDEPGEHLVPRRPGRPDVGGQLRAGSRAAVRAGRGSTSRRTARWPSGRRHRRLPHHLAREGRLADAGLAGNEQHAAVTGGRFGEIGRGGPQVGLSLHQPHSMIVRPGRTRGQGRTASAPVQPAGGLGDRPGQRRVDGERVRRPGRRSAGASTASAIGKISSLARGATTTPPTHDAACPGRQNSLTKPSRTPCILARALRRQRQLDDRRRSSPAVDVAPGVTPTVAISGSVKTFDDTVSRSSGATASPSACHIAIRPCIAATDASIRTPVQSPAA